MSKNDGISFRNAVTEAKDWMKIFNEKNKTNPSVMVKNQKPPSYRKIKANKVKTKYEKQEHDEYTECKCRKHHETPCTIQNKCENVATLNECDPNLCPANEKCENQNFRRGEKFAFEIKLTEAKGWGLFAKETIPNGTFVIEYMGEVIDIVEFNQRFSRAKANKEKCFYFLKLDTLYIDASQYGNDARFINHACDPNVELEMWTVHSNGQPFKRIGFFALRDIQPVCIFFK